MNKFKQHLLLLLLSFCSMVSYAYDFEVDGLYYDLISVNKRTCKLVGIESSKVNIELPVTVLTNGQLYSVSEIDWKAFENRRFELIVIPQEYTSVPANVFMTKSLIIADSNNELLLQQTENVERYYYDNIYRAYGGKYKLCTSLYNTQYEGYIAKDIEYIYIGRSIKYGPQPIYVRIFDIYWSDYDNLLEGYNTVVSSCIPETVKVIEIGGQTQISMGMKGEYDISVSGKFENGRVWEQEATAKYYKDHIFPNSIEEIILSGETVPEISKEQIVDLTLLGGIEKPQAVENPRRLYDAQEYFLFSDLQYEAIKLHVAPNLTEKCLNSVIWGRFQNIAELPAVLENKNSVPQRKMPIYGLNGIQMPINDGYKFKGLLNGIYITNGKKVLIK